MLIVMVLLREFVENVLERALVLEIKDIKMMVVQHHVAAMETNILMNVMILVINLV